MEFSVESILSQKKKEKKRESIPHLDIEIPGAGAFIHSPALFFDSHTWGHAQDLDDPHEGSSHFFSSIPGPIQFVQRAEYWGVILVLHAYFGIHIGIDNLNVLRGVAGLLSRKVPQSPRLRPTLAKPTLAILIFRLWPNPTLARKI